MKNLLTKLPANKLTRGIGTASMVAKKHSPLAFTVLGIVGTAATAYFAYKAQPRIEEIVTEMEEESELRERYLELKTKPVSALTDEEVIFVVEAEQDGIPTFDRFKYMRQIAGAIALPVATGVASIVAIGLSYRIMNGRVTGLASALTTVVAQKVELDKRMKSELTEEQYNKIVSPIEKVKKEVIDENGSKKVIEGDVKRRAKSLDGVWFDDSDQFVIDDHNYNIQYLSTAERILNDKLIRRGSLLLNEVYDELELPRTTEGMLLGWNYGDTFGFGIDTFDCTDSRTGDNYVGIYVNWMRPRYVYEDIDFDGRYGIFGGK